MLPKVCSGDRGPLLILLHWLGGGAQTWQEVDEALAARGVRCAAIDLPGFGDASSIAGYSVSAMADAVIETIQTLRAPNQQTPWLLAGHSMGGKVAAVIARRALEGTPGLEDLRALILISPSPPGPEPMPESKRDQMLESLGETSASLKKALQAAAAFIDDNTGKNPLPTPIRDRAIAGVLAMNRTALRHWLTSGSKEDWSTHVAALPLPAMLFAGTEDAALGPEAQRRHTLPHLPQAELISLDGSGHLSPLERPGELIEHLTQFLTTLNLSLTTSSLSPSFNQLLTSDRVSSTTRTVMQQRLATSESWNAKPTFFTPAEFRSLRALVARIIPNPSFDIAALIDTQLAANEPDGWRLAALPPDPAAWRMGLLSLDHAAHHADSVSFLALNPAQQDDLLHQTAAGTLSQGLRATLHLTEAFAPSKMRQWFEDARAAITRLYIADPRTMEEIGFTGFADDLGFTQIQLGQQEDFEQ